MNSRTALTKELVILGIVSLVFFAGCGSSASQPFNNQNQPSPTITTISPNSAAAGGAAFILTINGTNFVAASMVNFAGTARNTTFVSATQLTAAIPAAAIATTGTAAVTVTNPTPGGGTSNAMNFTINTSSLGTFTPTGDMTTARSFHTATLLRDGKVLIVGGGGVSAEIYDPATRTFAKTGALTTARSGPTATRLDDGRVLIVGGDLFTSIDPPVAPPKTTAELFDPSTGTFTRTADMVTVQIYGTATLLNSGKVLIAGGIMSLGGLYPNPAPAVVANPELYDPATGSFSLTGTFQSDGDGFFVTGGPNVSAATLLPDGRVLIAGEPDSELYDPVTGTFSLTGAMTTLCVDVGLEGRPQYITGRTATLLMNGKVLEAGGGHEDCGRFANAELYDPAAGKFAATGSMSRVRDNHTATLLPSGSVLITGGESEATIPGGSIFSGTEASAELYDVATGRFAKTGDMSARRAGHTATLLQDGTVLITGGYCYAGIGQTCGVFASAEIYKLAAVQ